MYVVAAARTFVDMLLVGAAALPETLPVETEHSALRVDEPACFVAATPGLLSVPQGGAAVFMYVRVLS